MNPDSNSLDEMLREWAKRRQPSAERRKVLHEQVLQAMIDDAGPGSGEDRVKLSSWRSGVAWFVAGATTAAVVGWLMFAVSPHPESGRATPDPALLARLTDNQIEKTEMVLAEVSRMFCGRLHWLAESNGDMELGISVGNDGASTADARPILIRVVVVSRDKDASEWKTEWSVDVATYEEKQVVLCADDGRPRLSLWSHRLPDNKVAIDTDLGLPGADRRTGGMIVMEPKGSPPRSFRVVASEREYQVFQSVACLVAR